MLNHITLMGRLTREPEVKSTQSGQTLASFGLAVDRDFQPGGAEKRCDFFDCTAWRNTAAFVERNLHKGQLVVVKGRMESRKWLDKNGQARVAWDVQVDDVYFAGDKPAATPTYDEGPKITDLSDSEIEGELPF